MKTTFIYALTEPGTLTIRYFGKANNPKKRRVDHIRDAKKGKKWRVLYWIRKLLKTEQRPDVHVLCEVLDNDWKRFEIAFITLGKQYNFDLTNLTDGGEGLCNPSPEVRKKISVTKKAQGLVGEKSNRFGTKCKPEVIAKLKAFNTGRKRLPQVGAKISAALTGKKHKDNTSGFSGVSRRKDINKWHARFMADKKIILVGNFSKIEDAVFARALAEACYYL